MRITRREMLAGAMASLPLTAYGQQVERPPARQGRIIPPLDISQILGTSGLGQDSSFVLMDLASGQVREGHNSALSRPPASVTKIITALYAGAQLGSGFRFETRLMGSGPIRNGVLEGDLYLVGGGDPQLDTDDLNTLVMEARAAGLRRVSGRFFVVSNSLPLIRQISEGQPVQARYNPSVSGLNLNFNRVYFEWKRQNGAYQVTMDARSGRVRPRIAGVQMRVMQRASPVYGYEMTDGFERWSVSRAALGKGGGRWLPVRDPARYAAEVFQVLAQAQGIALPTGQKRDRLPNMAVLASVKSGSLLSIQRNMLRYSTNLTAEVLGLSATRAAGGRVGNLRVSAQAMGRWMGGSSRRGNSDFFNHSGLTDQSKISPREMVSFLADNTAQRSLSEILREVTLVNTRGDEAKLPGIRVFAKSGTLNFTRGLAGYIEKDGQNRYAFAIFAADMPARSRIPAGEERPAGARKWRGVAKTQEKALVYRWASLL
ncbi:MAG: D-alanyl-D-alanine carboxypeptidase/D-alanyl-D-alanine-endopeptidase [Rhodobacteraceae bacterium]|nr:D-alanyl-D-alanine carboxypeptidase/D-alanyl-D-alanine-endopeptidase [Paracoccaceae bacterium]